MSQAVPLECSTSVVESRETTNAGSQNAPANPRVRVCHVSMCLKTGGLERLLVDFARFHDRDRFELAFVALEEDGPPVADIRATNCPVKILNDDGRVKKLRSLQQLARWFSERRIQVVHTHNTFAQFYGAMAAKLAGVPIVVNTQHGAGCGKNWRAEWQFRLANRLTQRIVGVSEDSTRRCQQQDGGSRHKMTTIWNGINLDRFLYHGPKLEPIAICVARLSPLKDFPTLLRATELVRRQVPDFRLRIVGDGPERTKLELLISELGIERHVELLGERQDVSQLLANSGFFVSATLSEGVSLTLLEAMAVGLPVLTTRVGGNPEVVLDSQTGRLVAPSSPSELADAMVTMCHEQDLWATMGLLGRQRVEQYFEIRNMVRAYESLYRELLQKVNVLI